MKKLVMGVLMLCAVTTQAQVPANDTAMKNAPKAPIKKYKPSGTSGSKNFDTTTNRKNKGMNSKKSTAANRSAKPVMDSVNINGITNPNAINGNGAVYPNGTINGTINGTGTTNPNPTPNGTMTGTATPNPNGTNGNIPPVPPPNVNGTTNSNGINGSGTTGSGTPVNPPPPPRQ